MNQSENVILFYLKSALFRLIAPVGKLYDLQTDFHNCMALVKKN